MLRKDTLDKGKFSSSGQAMSFTYRTLWLHWPIVAIFGFIYLSLTVCIGVWLLHAFKIERENGIAVRIISFVTEGFSAVLMAVLTMRCMRLVDQFYSSRPIVLTDDGFRFTFNGMERRVRWADVNNVNEDLLNDNIVIGFKRQMASEIRRQRRSDERFVLSRDRIAPSAEVFLAQVRLLMDAATASLPKDRHVEYAYVVR